jgi:putative hydrolase of the HAD superfamily
MRLSSPVRTILFDVGNTLVFLDHGRLARILESQGHRRELARVRAAEHRARRCVAAAGSLAASGDDASRWLRFLEELVGAAEIDGSEREAVRRAIHEAHREENLWRSVPDDTRPTLDALRDAGFRLGVVSNADGRVDSLLRDLALRDAFDVIVDSHRVGIEKPDPAIFALALAELDADPATSLFVGDSYAIDVLGARAAGMHAALLDPLGMAGAVDCIVIHALGEVPSLVNESERSGARTTRPGT